MRKETDEHQSSNTENRMHRRLPKRQPSYVRNDNLSVPVESPNIWIPLTERTGDTGESVQRASSEKPELKKDLETVLFFVLNHGKTTRFGWARTFP